MNVRQLKKMLENAPDDMDVFIVQTNDDFTFSLAENAKIKNVDFIIEENNKNINAKQKCFVISDEI